MLKSITFGHLGDTKNVKSRGRMHSRTSFQTYIHPIHVCIYQMGLEFGLEILFTIVIQAYLVMVNVSRLQKLLDIISGKFPSNMN